MVEMAFFVYIKHDSYYIYIKLTQRLQLVTSSIVIWLRKAVISFPCSIPKRFYSSMSCLLHLGIHVKYGKIGDCVSDWHLGVFSEPLDMTTVDIQILADRLTKFYCEARPQQSDTEELCHKHTLKNIRGAINRSSRHWTN